MRRIALAVAIVLLGTFAALAQKTNASCEKYCREKQCASANAVSWCMQKCIPNCQMINEKKKK